jgi:lysophospholipase L1-like esterase
VQIVGDTTFHSWLSLSDIRLYHVHFKPEWADENPLLSMQIGTALGQQMQTSRARLWVLRLSLVLLGLFPFILAEIALRLTWTARLAPSSDPFLDCSQLTPLFELNGDHYQIPKTHLSLFAPAQFPAHKAANTHRIFCLGGSTTQGEPYRPPTAFPAWLELNLRLTDPARRWEVINCGGLSYASYRLLPILIEILQYQPDLVVVDCGHNEFLEERELSPWKNTPATLRSGQRFANSLRLVQFVSEYTSRLNNRSKLEDKGTRLASEVDALLDYQGGLEKYHRGNLHRESVVNSMRWNITAMIHACDAAHIPILLLVPTSNIRDCPPFKVEPSEDLNSASKAQIDSYWTQAKNSLDSTGTETQQALEAILTIDSQYAAALYWLGQIELTRGHTESARRFLTSARDSDVCPLRATTEIQNSIRELGRNNRVWWLDVDEMFQSVSDNGLVGNQWLVDHVHPRIEGHQMLGEHLTDLLIEKSWVQPKSNDWKATRSAIYRTHLEQLGEDYFVRGKQRLAGLILWTQGRAKKGLIFPESRP